MKMITAIMLLAAASASAQSKPKKVLYYLDSVLIVFNPMQYNYYNGILSPADVAYTNMVPARKGLRYAAERSYDSIAHVFTKAYIARSEEERRIPASDHLEGRRETSDIFRYYYQNKPYTGKIIDYHFNGKKEEEGMLEDGWKTGPFKRYDEDGNFYSTRTYTKEGDSLSVIHTDAAGIVFRTELFRTDESSERQWWYANGKLKKTVSIKKHRSVEVTYHSDGRIKDSLTTWNRFVKRRGKFEEVASLLHKKDFNAALLADPRNAEIYYLRAFQKIGDLQFDAALSDIDTAITMEPLEPVYYGQRAITRIQKYAYLRDKTQLYDDHRFYPYLAEHPLNIPAEEKALIMKDLETASGAGTDYDRYYKLYHYLKNMQF